MARELTLMEHLRELRRRVLICVIAVMAGSAASFAFYKQIIDFLARPAYNLESGARIELVFIEVTELLTTAVKVSFVAGFVLALPVILYQVVMFIAPGLTGRERRYLFAVPSSGAGGLCSRRGLRILCADPAGAAISAGVQRCGHAR